ncbi:MAG: type VI secretion system tube protein Hcp [Acidobacteriota bacterium]
MSDKQDKPGFASFIGRPLLAGAVVASAALPAPAVADVFLKIDSIPGESMDSKHKGEIDILSYTQSFRQSINRATGSGGGTVNKVSCGDIMVLKNIDKSSLKLIEAVTTGVHIPMATLTFRTVGRGTWGQVLH